MDMKCTVYIKTLTFFANDLLHAPRKTPLILYFLFSRLLEMVGILNDHHAKDTLLYLRRPFSRPFASTVQDFLQVSKTY